MQNIQPYVQWYKIEPQEYEKSNKFHVICISSNNDRHTFQMICISSNNDNTLFIWSVYLLIKIDTLFVSSVYLLIMIDILFIWCVYLLIMIDTLFVRLSLHFTTLHYTCRQFISSYLYFTQPHSTTLHYPLIWLNPI